MATKQELRLGDIVFFGRPNGEKTKGKVVKLNPKRAKVQQLEARGYSRRRSSDAVWNVAYPLISKQSSRPPRMAKPQASAILLGRVVDHGAKEVRIAGRPTPSDLNFLRAIHGRGKGWQLTDVQSKVSWDL